MMQTEVSCLWLAAGWNKGKNAGAKKWEIFSTQSFVWKTGGGDSYLYLSIFICTLIDAGIISGMICTPEKRVETSERGGLLSIV